MPDQQEGIHLDPKHVQEALQGELLESMQKVVKLTALANQQQQQIANLQTALEAMKAEKEEADVTASNGGPAPTDDGQRPRRKDAARA